MFQRAILFGLFVRKTLTVTLFKKILRLPVSGVTDATPGKLITLASGDMALIEQGAWGLPFVAAAPLSTIFQVVVLFKIVRIE